MSASMHWNFLAQYSILKEVFADLRSIATTSSTEPMEEMEEEKSKGAEEEHRQSGAQGQTRHRPAGEQCSVDKSSVYGSCLAMRTLVFFMQFQ